jgi:hypothetical protein
LYQGRFIACRIRLKGEVCLQVPSAAIDLYAQLAEAQKQLETAIAMFAPGVWTEPATPHGRALREHLICLTQKMGEAIKWSGAAQDTWIAPCLFLPEVGNARGAADLLCAFYRMEHLARRLRHLYESYGVALSPEVHHRWVDIIEVYRHGTGAIREQSRDPALHAPSFYERWRRGDSLTS